MNTWDKCKNCGGERGLHHFETDQCPVGGREAPIGRKQEWKSTTFEIESESEVEELEEKVDILQGESTVAESVRVWGAG